MYLRIRDSLLLSLGIVISTITLLAFASMAASIFIADTTQGFATAINESGALRMRSYRIATNLTHNNTEDKKHQQETYQLITEFETHLYSDNLTSIIPDDSQSPLAFAYKNIETRWLNEIRPLFSIYIDGIVVTTQNSNDARDMSISRDAVKNLRNRYLLVVPDFVKNIDQLVSLLENDAEAKIKNLRSFQYIALLITIALTFIALVLIYRRIHRPLKQLLAGAERASHSDFSFRIDYTGKDELGQLGSAFNSMAQDLSKIYNELEERIHRKTIDLEQSNQSLELLYTTVNKLNQADSPLSTFDSILQDIETISSIGRGAIFLSNNHENNAVMLASTLLEEDASYLLYNKLNSKQALNDEANQITKALNKNNKPRQIINMPIKDQSQQYGALIIEPDHEQPVEPWQLQLIETIAHHIGIAIRLSQQSTESRRLILIEERGAIARELHDSLAQSLTFMKIQLSRLQAIITKKQTNSEEEKIIAELRLGLNSAYKELRELLTTFRLKIDGHDFRETLKQTVDEFNKRSETLITFSSQISYFDLTPNEEIHVLQLIREALSNIVKHSQATTANIEIEHNQHGDIQVTISDNGIGIPQNTEKTHHYGINIMKERAKTLKGIFNIYNNPDGGTSISLTFTPANITTPVNLTNEGSH